MEEDAYSLALEYLCAGAMPVIVDVGDNIHVVSILPTSTETLRSMIHDDPAIRLRFICAAVKAVKEKYEKEVEA